MEAQGSGEQQSASLDNLVDRVYSATMKTGPDNGADNPWYSATISATDIVLNELENGGVKVSSLLPRILSEVTAPPIEGSLLGQLEAFRHETWEEVADMLVGEIVRSELLMRHVELDDRHETG